MSAVFFASVSRESRRDGTTIAAAFFGNYVKDKSTVSGNNKFDYGIVGISQVETANPDHVLLQTFAFVDNLEGFTINGSSKIASLHTTVEVLNSADGTTVPVTLALDFQTTGEVFNDFGSRDKFRFGDFTFLTVFKELTTLASVRGTASWTAGGVSTTVIAPLSNGGHVRDTRFDGLGGSFFFEVEERGGAARPHPFGPAAFRSAMTAARSMVSIVVHFGRRRRQTVIVAPVQPAGSLSD